MASQSVGTAVQQLVASLTTLGLPLEGRPAHPAIKSPDSGSTIAVSSTVNTPLTVTFSTNRPGISYTVQLFDGDTFAPASAPDTVTPTSNVCNANIQIPPVASGSPKVFLLQCTPSDPTGNVHRVLFRAQPPIAIPAPTVTGTLGTGAAFPPGTYSKATTAGLNAVTFNATSTVTSPTYSWTLEIGGFPIPVATTGGTAGPFNFSTVAAGTHIKVSVSVSDGTGNSPATVLDYDIIA